MRAVAPRARVAADTRWTPQALAQKVEQLAPGLAPALDDLDAPAAAAAQAAGCSGC